MITAVGNWLSRNIELIVWFNIALLFVSAIDEFNKGNWYPMGLCAVLAAVTVILRK